LPASGKNSPVSAWDSIVYRLLGFAGAVAAGVALWSFAGERWLDGIGWGLVVAGLAAAYRLGQRRLNKRSGKRRY
jgi:hypothetical protein